MLLICGVVTPTLLVRGGTLTWLPVRMVRMDSLSSSSFAVLIVAHVLPDMIEKSSEVRSLVIVKRSDGAMLVRCDSVWLGRMRVLVVREGVSAGPRFALFFFSLESKVGL